MQTEYSVIYILGQQYAQATTSKKIELATLDKVASFPLTSLLTLKECLIDNLNINIKNLPTEPINEELKILWFAGFFSAKAVQNDIDLEQIKQSAAKNLYPDDIKKQRKSLGYKQSDIAEMVNLTRSSYSTWEAGKQPINKKYYKTLSELLGFSVEELQKYTQKINYEIRQKRAGIE